MVVIRWQRGWVGFCGQGLFIESVFKDGLNAFVTVGAECQCAVTGGIQPFDAIGLAEP